MTYDFKAAFERMTVRRQEIIRQKDGKAVEGLPPLETQKDGVVAMRKIKTQEKSE